MTATPRLIALCSSAMGSGKTTVAEHLVEQHGFVRVAFATPLKAMTMGLLTGGLGMTHVEAWKRVYGDRKEEVIPTLGISSRRFQQLAGTEFGRDLIRDSVWTDITLAAADAHLAAGRSVVIDDMRFPNEFHAVTGHGGECRRIVRPGTAVTTAHASEGQLDLVQMPEIWNTGGKDELFAAVDRSLFS